MSRRLDAIRDAFIALGTATLNEFLTLTFLAHQTLLSADAVLRTFYRRIVSRQRLLQWETAAEAEMGTGKLTFVDALLNWTPVVALIVGIIVYFSHRHSFTVALPVLILWACSKPVSLWLNRPPRPVAEGGYPAGQTVLAVCRVVQPGVILRAIQPGTQLAYSRQCSGGAGQDCRSPFADESRPTVECQAGCV